MAWDATRHEVLLFGGDTATGQSAALDAWDGVRWRSLDAGGPDAPQPRDDALLVGDPARGVVVLHGGRSGRVPQTDTWEWDGAAWSRHDVEGPSARAHAAAAYDPKSRRVILYGGVGETEAFRDTWAWDGSSWTLLDERGIPDRAPSGMAWDAKSRRLLVLAVNLNATSADQTYPSELWAWSGKRWELVADGGPRFSPLQSFVAGAGAPLLLDGGVVQGEFSTWQWTGSTWKRRMGTQPTIRNGQAAAANPDTGDVFLFGGFVDQATFGDLWSLAGGKWTLVSGDAGG